jgi:DNA-binding response OmpR family regulator
MERRILVVEDDPHFRKQLRDYFEYMGWSARLAENGQEAIDLFRQLPADLVLCDVMLPGIDGFEAVAEIRDLPGGEEAVVVMVSAVWNDVARFESKLRRIDAAEFHRKPLSIVDLGRRISTLLDEPDRFGDAAATRSGQWRSDELDTAIKQDREALPSLGSYTPIELMDLLIRMFREGRSGVIDLRTEVARRRLWLLDGYPVRARSDRPAESLASVLLSQGILPPEDVPGLLFASRRTGRSVAELVVQAGKAGARDVLKADRERTRRILLGAMAPPDGFYELREGEDFATRGRLEEVHPLPILWDVVQAMSLRDLGEELARRSTHLVVRGPDYDRLHSELPLPTALHWLGPALNQGSRLSDLLAHQRGSSSQVLKALWLMVRLGIASTVSEERAPRADQIGPRPTPPPSLVIRAEADDSPLDSRSRGLLREYLGLDHADHYRLMGIQHDASENDIKKAWRRRAASWRPVAIDDEIPPEVRTKARELLARLAEAETVLVDPDSRSAYDEERRREQRPTTSGSTATERLLAARSASAAGRWTEAELELRAMLEDHPSSTEVLTSLAWAIFRSPSGRSSKRLAETVELLRRARELAPGHDRVLRQLAMVYAAAGEADEARSVKQELDAMESPEAWPTITSQEELAD